MKSEAIKRIIGAEKVKYRELPKLCIRFSVLPYIIQAASIIIRLIYAGISGEPFSLNVSPFPYIGMLFEIAAVILMSRRRLKNNGLFLLATVYLALVLTYTVMIVI